MSRSITRTIICKNDNLPDFNTLMNILNSGMHNFCREVGAYPKILYMGQRELFIWQTSPEYRESMLYTVPNITKTRNPRQKFRGLNLRKMKTDGMKLQLIDKGMISWTRS